VVHLVDLAPEAFSPGALRLLGEDGARVAIATGVY
jgi:hypothetical protein